MVYCILQYLFFFERGENMFYLIFVLVGSLLVALTNFFVSNVYTLRAFGEILLSVIVGVCILFLIDALTAFLIRRMPERWFAPEAKFFSVSPTERKFYRRIKINSWKKYVLQLRNLTQSENGRCRRCCSVHAPCPYEIP